MVLFDEPYKIENQIELMKKYVIFSNSNKMKDMLNYTGYFRLSRYGKFLLAYTNVMKKKPTQRLLFELYDFDSALRRLFFVYCKKAEIQFKTHLTNSISLTLNDSTFYLKESSYTATKSENDRKQRESNKYKFTNIFFPNMQEQEEVLRKNRNKYPELKEYRTGGDRANLRIPCWAAFAYFDFGAVQNIYEYLRGDLRKVVLTSGYSRGVYGKEITKQFDTWLDAVRNLRNICAHHYKLVGKTSSIVLMDRTDDPTILLSSTDLFSRIYALKKILNPTDSQSMKSDLERLISRVKFDVNVFNILPEDWQERFDRITYL